MWKAWAVGWLKCRTSTFSLGLSVDSVTLQSKGRDSSQGRETTVALSKIQSQSSSSLTERRLNVCHRSNSPGGFWNMWRSCLSLMDLIPACTSCHACLFLGWGGSLVCLKTAGCCFDNRSLGCIHNCCLFSVKMLSFTFVEICCMLLDVHDHDQTFSVISSMTHERRIYMNVTKCIMMTLCKLQKGQI